MENVIYVYELRRKRRNLTGRDVSFYVVSFGDKTFYYTKKFFNLGINSPIIDQIATLRYPDFPLLRRRNRIRNGIPQIGRRTKEEISTGCNKTRIIPKDY